MTEKSFASLVHRKVVGNRELPVRAIADAMGMKEPSLWARLYDRTPFSADELRLFFSVVHDVEIASYLLALSPLIAVKRSDHAGSPAESLQRSALRAMLEATDIVRATEQALVDGRLDRREKDQIREQILETEGAVASLKQLMATLG